MAVTMRDVRSLLASEEPRYEDGARLGAGAIPHLAVLVHDKDPLLASKAAYLASLIGTEDAADVVRAAAESSEPTVRVAAAAGAQNLGGAATSDVLDALASDADDGVRKTALRSQAGDIGVVATTAAAVATRDAVPMLGLGQNEPGPGAPPNLMPAPDLDGAAGEGGGSIDGTADHIAGFGRASGVGEGGGSVDGVADDDAGRGSGVGEGGGSINGSDGTGFERPATNNGDAAAAAADDVPYGDAASMGRAPAGDGGGRY